MGIAVLAAIILQEMATRLGLVTRRDLSAVLVETFPSPLARRVTIGLVLSAILIGNGAYQAGNLTGASAGLAVLLGGRTSIWVILTAGIAVGCLMSGAYHPL